MSTAPATPASPDVLALITTEILRHAEEHGPDVDDATIVSAIRGLLKGSSAATAASLALRGRLELVAERPNVEGRAFRQALKLLLDLADEHRDSRNSGALIRYLAVLAS